VRYFRQAATSVPPKVAVMTDERLACRSRQDRPLCDTGHKPLAWPVVVSTQHQKCLFLKLLTRGEITMMVSAAMRSAASPIDDQRSFVRVAPRVFLRDGELVRHRQGEQRRQEYAPGLPARTLEAAGERT
jgi:hypothetical protein